MCRGRRGERRALRTRSQSMFDPAPRWWPATVVARNGGGPQRRWPATVVARNGGGPQRWWLRKGRRLWAAWRFRQDRFRHTIGASTAVATTTGSAAPPVAAGWRCVAEGRVRVCGGGYGYGPSWRYGYRGGRHHRGGRVFLRCTAAGAAEREPPKQLSDTCRPERLRRPPQVFLKSIQARRRVRQEASARHRLNNHSSTVSTILMIIELARGK
jgi:hypothetical protein